MKEKTWRFAHNLAERVNGITYLTPDLAHKMHGELKKGRSDIQEVKRQY